MLDISTYAGGIMATNTFAPIPNAIISIQEYGGNKIIRFRQIPIPESPKNTAVNKYNGKCIVNKLPIATGEKIESAP